MCILGVEAAFAADVAVVHLQFGIKVKLLQPRDQNACLIWKVSIASCQGLHFELED